MFMDGGKPVTRIRQSAFDLAEGRKWYTIEAWCIEVKNSFFESALGRQDPEIFPMLKDVTIPNLILLLSNASVDELEERIIMMNNSTNQNKTS
jgi:hypothetical protein